MNRSVLQNFQINATFGNADSAVHQELLNLGVYQLAAADLRLGELPTDQFARWQILAVEMNTLGNFLINKNVDADNARLSALRVAAIAMRIALQK